ncbi:MAG: uroporphyrinogen-III synthase, partial [Chloroflexi bacterium]|nr:uroporphyrinogen-III synthase [Chloroflexota bacterium]
ATLVDGLAALGVAVDEVPAYRTTTPSFPSPLAGEGQGEGLPSPATGEGQDGGLPGIQMLRDGRIDVVTFASSSTVRNLVQLLGGDVTPLQKPLIACIGPITAQTARNLGLRVDIQASDYTIPGLVEALKGHFSNAS